MIAEGGINNIPINKQRQRICTTGAFEFGHIVIKCVMETHFLDYLKHNLGILCTAIFFNTSDNEYIDTNISVRTRIYIGQGVLLPLINKLHLVFICFDLVDFNHA